LTGADPFLQEVEAGGRFEFGRNWQRFLRTLDEPRIAAAEQGLRSMLEAETLNGKSFIDIGSGSGLMSLAARRLGARVHSFDFDPSSVSCTAALRSRYFPQDAQWSVARGSILDADALRSLGRFDIVYSWGVLHHTGSMWEAVANAAELVGAGGLIFIALYNDQGRASRMWKAVKQLYNRLPAFARWLVVVPAFARLWGPTLIRDALHGAPLRSWSAYGRERGMAPWRDVIDWVGGLPFEVATPEQVFDFLSLRGFTLRRLKTCGGGHGCNEFVFEKPVAGRR